MVAFTALSLALRPKGREAGGAIREAQPMTEEEEKDLLIRYADYFRRAEEADAMAAVANNEVAGQSLRAIALGWRELAAQVKRRMEHGE